ncbi:MAG: hypothetical protein EXR92_04805 [Gemmatimonadetes bacterium]|nr:hypothetical protein [Gemmatimonadota bacterium]
MGTHESEVRRALGRLQRAIEKSHRELEALSAALRHAEGDDFPRGEYAGAESAIQNLLDFTESEGRRLEDKILTAGGLEPGRVRRSSSS